MGTVLSARYGWTPPIVNKLSVPKALEYALEWEIQKVREAELTATTFLALGSQFSKKHKAQGEKALSSLKGEPGVSREPWWKKDKEAQKMLREIEEHNKQYMQRKQEDTTDDEVQK